MMIRQYESMRKIGEGGTSKVYLVRDTETDLLFAMKVYEFTELQRENRFFFQREKEILEEACHRGIPMFREAIIEENIGYIVMEYIAGNTLFDRLNAHQLTPKELNIIRKQTSAIFSYLHAQSPRIYYMDLKPANIMVSDDLTVHLIDFGSCLLGGEETHQISGTIKYRENIQNLTDLSKIEQMIFKNCFQAAARMLLKY